MPVHTFTEIAGEEACVCPECSYILIPEGLKGRTEREVIEYVVERRASVADARTIFGAFLVANEELLPSSQRLLERIADLMAAARVANWRPPEEEDKVPVGISKVAEVIEQRAKAYSQKYGVGMDQARHAAMNAVDAPPVPVSEVSAKIEQRAAIYAKEHNVTFSVAVEKVLAADPALAKQYLAVPVFPNVTAATEESQEQLLATLSLSDLRELCVSRKLAATDALMRLLVYDWFVQVDGQAHGSKEAADKADAFWTLVHRERFRREGFVGDATPGR